MDNSGVYTLAGLQVTSAALSEGLLTPIVGLDGMTAVTLEADFNYGSGGATCSVIVATSFDGGTNWRHIARFDFTTASQNKQCNLEGLLSKGVTVYQDLASEGVNDGILGDQLAAIVLIGSTPYVATTLSVRASVR